MSGCQTREENAEEMRLDELRRENPNPVDPEFRLAREILDAPGHLSPNSLIVHVLELLYDTAPQYTKAKIQQLFD